MIPCGETDADEPPYSSVVPCSSCFDFLLIFAVAFFLLPFTRCIQHLIVDEDNDDEDRDDGLDRLTLALT